MAERTDTCKRDRYRQKGQTDTGKRDRQIQAKAERTDVGKTGQIQAKVSAVSNPHEEWKGFCCFLNYIAGIHPPVYLSSLKPGLLRVTPTLPSLFGSSE